MHFCGEVPPPARKVHKFVSNPDGACIPFALIVLVPYSTIFNEAFSSISLWMDPVCFSLITCVSLELVLGVRDLVKGFDRRKQVND